jgi:UrcA family protein
LALRPVGGRETKARKNIMSIFKSAVIALALLGGVAGVASASETSERYEHATARVTFADLNLDSDAGAKAFLKRANKAAQHVCGGSPKWQPLMLELMRAYKKCHAAAMKVAVTQVDSKHVTALYTGTAARVSVLASR